MTTLEPSTYTEIKTFFQYNVEVNSKKFYKNSEGKVVDFSLGYSKLKNEESCVYKEAHVHLANLTEVVNISFLEQWSSKNKKYKVCLLYPEVCKDTFEVEDLGKTKEELQHAYLNQVAYCIEKYCGNTIGCHSSYQDMLSPFHPSRSHVY